MRIFCLDVGQGDCTFVLPPDEAGAILFDCRDTHVARMFVNNRRHPIRELRAIVFSHLDWDHIAGGQQFIRDFLSDGGRIRYVYIGADRDLDTAHERAKVAKELVDFARSLESWGAIDAVLAPLADPAEVDRSTDERDWSVRIVAPRQGVELGAARGAIGDDPNVHSAVLRVEFAGKAMIVGGDAPLASWARMPARDIRADAVRAPHHGGALTDGGVPQGWSAERLYAEIGPNYGIISVGTGNDHGHPTEAWAGPLFRREGCSTVCTQLTPRCEPTVREESGAKTFRERNLPDAEYAEPAWRHRQDRREAGPAPRFEVPCAGTVEIVIHEDGRIERFPAVGSRHTTHVVQHLARAWCVHGPPASQDE
ncbi:ComEC/Rec2 family competence protein [Sorangium sp. So ce1000]|uniref:ComEC/Rec2 family competence protein n=1 Tax=Sorangium sp. So ce1000 TaxID=3133325 RepID=UPI003F621FDD